MSYPRVYTLNGYHESALDTLVCPPKERLYYLAMKLCSEAGEVAGKIAKKILSDTQDDWSHEDRIAVLKELGDVLWYVAILSGHFGFSLETVANTNLDKLSDRKARGVLHGDGDNR